MKLTTAKLLTIYTQAYYIGDGALCSYRLYQYGDQCAWMRNSKFLRELENDNVDSEIVSEELRCLQDDEQPRSL